MDPDIIHQKNTLKLIIGHDMGITAITEGLV